MMYCSAGDEYFEIEDCKTQTKNPFKKFICILAMKYWRWFQRTIGVNNDR